MAVNVSCLLILGAKDSSTVFRLRPGEAVYYFHAKEEVGGSGTSKYCSTKNNSREDLLLQSPDFLQNITKIYVVLLVHF